MFKENIDKLLKMMKSGKNIYYNGIYSNMSEFLIDCKKYLQANPYKYNEVKLLIDIYCLNDKENAFFIDNMISRCERKYVYKLQSILKVYVIDKEKGYQIANKLYKSNSSFISAMKKFENKFINSALYMPYLIDISKHVQDEVKVKNQTYLRYATLGTNREYLDIVYESGLSLIDYAHLNLIDYHLYNEAIYSRSENKAKEVRKRPIKYLPELLEIINKVSNNELTYIEYFKLTKLSPYVLKKIASENNINNKNLSIFYSRYSNNNPKINKELELNTQKSINNMEISRNTVEQVFDYLEENEIPVNSITYNELLRTYIKKRAL